MFLVIFGLMFLPGAALAARSNPYLSSRLLAQTNYYDNTNVLPPQPTVLEAAKEVVQNLTQGAKETAQQAVTAVQQAVQTAIADPGQAAAQVATAAKQTAQKAIIEPTKTIEQTKAVQTAAPAAVAVAAVSTPALFIQMVNFLFYIFHRFLALLGIRKKTESWGVVYDSETKKPIPLAIVRIFEAQLNQLLQTQVTDRQGRFGFLVQPGTYRIKVSSYQYNFFSQKKDEALTGPYGSAYYGEDIKVASNQSIVKVNIPGDPKKPILNHSAKITGNPLIGRLRRLTSEISEILLWGGLILTVLMCIFKPNWLNFVVLPLYGLPIATMAAARTRKSAKNFGLVFDGENKKPLANAQVRIFDPQSKRLLGLTLTDKLGRYGFVGIPPGSYALTAILDKYRFEGPKIKASLGEEGITGKLVRVGPDGKVAEQLPLRYIGDVRPNNAPQTNIPQPA